ncbi:MAG: hypothetical protein V3T84_11655 [Phycisphaerales bacterium]
MKTNVLPITAGVFGSLALAVSASAQFTGATIEEIDLGAPEGFVTYRVVAHFAGKDLLLAWGGMAGEGPLDFFTGNGVELLNAGGKYSGLKAEDFPAFPIAEAYDSWVSLASTIDNVDDGTYDDGFLGSDGVHAVIVGSSFHEEDGLVYSADPIKQAHGPEVVLAQFTLAEGNGFHLAGNVAWSPQGAGPGFNVSPFVVDNIPGPCPWDLDGNGVVGATDLLSLLVNWGPCNYCPPDFDNNGVVGATDLLALLVNWGPCP